MKLSEKDKQVLFAALALCALGAVAAVFLFSQPADNPSDGSEFYYSLTKAETVGFLYDVRGADEMQTQAIYQCGVDIISKGRFVGKALQNIGCDSEGCLAASSGKNGTSRMTFDQAKKKLSGMPYIQVGPDAVSSYKFFQRHMEIYIGNDPGNATKCDIAASES